MQKLVIATNNHHKLRELRTLLGDVPLELVSLADLPHPPVLVEESPTFAGNALAKARTIHAHTGLPALADDSGLEVFYLNGRPGVYSARYSGEHSTDAANNDKLLAEMRGVPPRRRGAQFRAVLALVGKGFEELAEGICTGKLAEVPRGTNGFGYDPIFIPDGFSRTYAELTDEEKNRISHRSLALETMKAIIEQRLLSSERTG